VSNRDVLAVLVVCTTMGVIYYYLFDQQKRYAAALKGMDE
jgi:hypothetical protein